MNIAGEFTTAASTASLGGLGSAGSLTRVAQLRDVEADADGRVRAVFTPSTPLGPIPLATTIVIEHADDSGATLRVSTRRGAQTVDVDLRLAFDADDQGTRVSWDANVRLGGAGASVGQRVARDVAARAIAGALESAAAQA